MQQPLLTVDNLNVTFKTAQGTVTAVDGVSFTVGQGANLGIVGESGCGKSVTALSLMGLVPSPPGTVKANALTFAGRDLLRLTPAEYRRLRGREMGMVFQEPMTSLNPVFTIGNQIMEAVRTHFTVSRRQARELAVAMLDRVGMPEPAKLLADYPHQLSGGMRQRVMIAMALICKPKLLLADEPTTALDVTIQAQVLDLMQELRREMGMSMIMITHDLGVVAEVAEQVAIMYAGMIVEKGTAEALFQQPLHPYTKGLLNSIPRLDQPGKRLTAIPGMVPDMLHIPRGCRFANRCRQAMAVCRDQVPGVVVPEPGHQVCCWLYS
ncbi:MAG: ABC transporter ATP-binding protein [Deltaproteobacteria bacterium]|nr:ABC transporter ATP-binding protein [Candidatus Anaeroferrophillus wilburensis]MBN2888734.1 ABC transporter ATP-binding protein [Deltaproteobacteria bacterium]